MGNNMNSRLVLLIPMALAAPLLLGSLGCPARENAGQNREAAKDGGGRNGRPDVKPENVKIGREDRTGNDAAAAAFVPAAKRWVTRVTPVLSAQDAAKRLEPGSLV